MQEEAEKRLVEILSSGGAQAWPAFVDSCTPTLLRIVGLFAKTYDERMDLFLFVCSKLRENNMKRLRSFRYRPEAPCRFTTWLSVVVRNLALDHDRAQKGRFRPFRSVESLGEVEQAVFNQHLRDGVPLRVVRHRLRQEQNVEMDEGSLVALAANLRNRLSPSQRWRLLARLAERRGTLSIDSTGEDSSGIPEPAADKEIGPEETLHNTEAADALQTALHAVRPRARLALALRFRDGLSAIRTARVLKISAPEADRLAHDGLSEMREVLARSDFGPSDFAMAAAGADSDQFWPKETA